MQSRYDFDNIKMSFDYRRRIEKYSFIYDSEKKFDEPCSNTYGIFSCVALLCSNNSI